MSEQKRLDRHDRERIDAILRKECNFMACDEENSRGELFASDREILTKQILALIPDTEEALEKQHRSSVHHYDIAMKVAVEVAKKQYKDYIVGWLDDIFLCKFYDAEAREELCHRMWQALKEEK